MEADCGVLYVDYEFPGVTTTFTWREVKALRSEGIRVKVTSVRNPRVALLSDEAKELIAGTNYVGKPGIPSCLWSLCRLSVRHPIRVFRCVVALASPVRPVRKYASFVYHLLWSARYVDTNDLNDVTIIHAPFAAGQGSMAMFIALLSDKRLWITSHAYDLYSDRIALRRKLRVADLFVTISEANRQWLASQYPQASAGVEVVRLGIDPSGLVAKQVGALHVPASIVSVGSLNPKKGHDVLIQALAVLRDRNTAFQCSIIGEGSHRSVLERLILESGLENHVRLLGSVPNDETRSLVGEADLFVLACRIGPRGDRDGIPVALMEAMAAGVPCVSTTVSGIPELVVPQVTGLVCRPDDVRALADAMEQMLTDRQLAARLAANARAHVEREFDLDKNAEKLARAVFALCGRKFDG